MYISKIDKYLKILTDNEVKNFVVIYFGEYSISTKEKQNAKLCVEQNTREVTCVHRYNIGILNIFDPERKLINNTFMLKTN